MLQLASLARWARTKARRSKAIVFSATLEQRRACPVKPPAIRARLVGTAPKTRRLARSADTAPIQLTKRHSARLAHPVHYLVQRVCSDPCLSGHFSNTTTAANSCPLCPEGSYQDQAGMSFCKPCGLGSYTSAKGQPGKQLFVELPLLTLLSNSLHTMRPWHVQRQYRQKRMRRLLSG